MKQAKYLISLMFVTGCTTAPTHFGNGSYENAGYEKPEHMTDAFNEYDTKGLLEGALKSIETCRDSKFRLETVMLGRLDNQTAEPIDIEMLNRELVDALSKRDYPMIDKTSRPDLFAEYEYNDTGLVDPTKAAVRGKQDGVKIMLRAVISSRVQQNKDEKVVRYRMSLQAVNLETARVLCTGEHELKKRYERVYAGF